MNAPPGEGYERDGWIEMIGLSSARGRLREVYDALGAARHERPRIYDTPGGDVANIVKSHSLDPEGLRLAFSLSGAVHWGPLSLPWREREMLNTVTSAANNCFY